MTSGELLFHVWIQNGKWKSIYVWKMSMNPQKRGLDLFAFQRRVLTIKATAWKPSWKFHFIIAIKAHSDDPRLARPWPYMMLYISTTQLFSLFPHSDVGTVHGTRLPAHHTSKYLIWPQHASVFMRTGFCKSVMFDKIVAFTGSATLHACLTITSFQSLRKL